MIRLNENSPQARMSKGWCIGDDAFRQDMVREAERRGVNLHRERFEGIASSELLAERQRAWEEKLRDLAKAADIDLTKLPQTEIGTSKEPARSSHAAGDLGHECLVSPKVENGSTRFRQPVHTGAEMQNSPGAHKPTNFCHLSSIDSIRSIHARFLGGSGAARPPDHPSKIYGCSSKITTQRPTMTIRSVKSACGLYLSSNKLVRIPRLVEILGFLREVRVGSSH